MEAMKSIIIGSLIAILGIILLAIICYVNVIDWKNGLFISPVFLLIGGCIATYLCNGRRDRLLVGVTFLLILLLLWFNLITIGSSSIS